MDKRELLEELRSMIPTMECIPGCTDCCGIVAWSRFEWDQLPNKLKKKYKPFQMICGFCESGKGCSAYEYRPLVCRTFGVVEGLACPHDVIVKEILTEKEVVGLTKVYVKHFFKEGNDV